MIHDPSALARAFTSACLLTLASLASAHQPLITDDTGTQGSGGNQLEFSYNHDREEQAGAKTRTRTVPLVFTRGLGDTLDFFVQANEGGSGNPSFGLKWRFHESEDGQTSLGVKPEVRHPLNPRGEPSPAEERKTYGLTAILTQAVAFGAIHANLYFGQDRFRDPINFPRINKTRLSVAPVWDVNESLKLALDLGIEHTTSAGARIDSELAELGLIYAPDKDLDIAAGIVRTVTGQHPHTTITAATIGLTWRFR